jgi:predicted N-acetyltransferase YhbS
MITIREETFHDVEAREALLDACFGAARFQKTCERLREGRMPADGLSLVIDRNGEIIGTVRLWHVAAGPNRSALMLGPIAIDPSVQSLGLGSKLMREALQRARGLVSATGAFEQKPDLGALVAAAAQGALAGLRSAL